MAHTKQLFGKTQKKGVYHGMVCITNVWRLGRLKNFGLADTHIHDINTVLREEKDVEDHHEPPLINFEKWTHLKDRALEALCYRDIPPKYSEDGLEAATGYLKQQLQGVSVDDDFSQILQTTSARLKEIEHTRPKSKTVDVMKKTGFG
jgi:hypothetical protein